MQEKKEKYEYEFCFAINLKENKLIKLFCRLMVKENFIFKGIMSFQIMNSQLKMKIQDCFLLIMLETVLSTDGGTDFKSLKETLAF